MKNKFLNFIGVLLLGVLTLTNVQAKSVLDAGDNVTATGVYNSSNFAFGNVVKSEGEVKGLSFVAGNDVSSKGSVEYGAYAGNMISINTNVEKDLFVAGNQINIGSDAVLGRDVYIAGSNVKINADVTRNLRVATGTLDISGITINGNAYVDAGQIIMDKDTKIIGKLTYTETSILTGKEEATIGELVAVEVDDIEVTVDFRQTIADVIVSIIAGFIVMAVLFYAFPKVKEKVDNTFKLEAKDIVGAMVKGLVVLICVPVVSVIGIVTGILTPLALIVLALYVIGLYLATLFASYVIGKELCKKVAKSENVYLALIVGIVLIKLIDFIPYLGGLVTTLCFFYGLGLIYNTLRTKED